MFRSLGEFEKTWRHESESTLGMLGSLTDASLHQAVTPRDRTLGRIAWHIVTTIPEMMGRTGLTIAGPGEHAPMPATAAPMVAAYDVVSKSLAAQVKEQWTDETLQQTDEMYGQTWKRGFTLTALINHQIHHRGQMTVLMRQAGLKVKGVYGPAREEWSEFGMPAPLV
jgi:uncharacterized damage-inducible protein DinB